MRQRTHNRLAIGISVASAIIALAGIGYVAHDAESYRFAKEASQDVDISNVCYFDDEPYYHEYVSAAAIPLMTLDKQSDDAPAELLDDEVLAVFHGFPWAEPNPAPDPHNPLGYRRSHVPDWMARGPLAQWFGGYGLKNSIGRNQHGVPCEVVVHSVPEPKILSLFFVMLGALLLISWRRR